ncbi:MAG: HAMP domain-containing protein, partial [Acidobacteriales bacterium]|nr:HAMP domain-containing protein [Terriglobales bacterium]
MRNRVFVKLLAVQAAGIVVAGLTFELLFRNSPIKNWALHGRVLLTCAVALLFAVVTAIVAARSVESRLARLVAAAREIRQGRLAARIADSSSDEIGMLAAALNKTADIVERRFAELRTSQHQLETLLNSMQDAVIAVGADDRVLWANHAMERLAPQRVRLSQAIVESVRDPDFLRVVHDASNSKQVVTDRATSILAGRTFDVTAAPMPGGGVVAVLHDLTETERVEKTRRDFIANVSHELRTPLTSIQGFTETLLDLNHGSESSRDFLEIIRKNAMRMSRLTEDLLALARVESGEQRFDPQPVSCGDLLREAVQSFSEIARAQGIEIVLDCEGASRVNA